MGDGKAEFNSFLDKVDEFIKSIPVDDNYDEVPDGLMFRGQHDAEWQLTPSIHRSLQHPNALANESNFFHVFATRASRAFQRDLSDWEILTIMQHHGVPTRLLDWTDSLGIALYFAVKGQKWNEPKPAAVWVLNGYALSGLAFSRRIITLGHEWFPDYKKHFVDTTGAGHVSEPSDWPYASPVPVEASWGHERLVAQKGLFTVHGHVSKPLDEQCDEKVLKKFEIPATAIPHARKYLRLAGIDHYTIFPDLEGLAANLKDRYCDVAAYAKISRL